MEMTPLAYHIAREDLARDLRAGLAPQTAEGVAAYVREAAALPASTAAWFTCRFLDDVKRHTERIKNVPI
jgi:hypothetical protein